MYDSMTNAKCLILVERLLATKNWNQYAPELFSESLHPAKLYSDPSIQEHLYVILIVSRLEVLKPQEPSSAEQAAVPAREPKRTAGALASCG